MYYLFVLLEMIFNIPDWFDLFICLFRFNIKYCGFSKCSCGDSNHLFGNLGNNTYLVVAICYSFIHSFICCYVVTCVDKWSHCLFFFCYRQL